MTPRQKLMLFFISCDPGIRDVQKMIMFYDRWDFPAKLTENLKPMLDDGLIKVTGYDTRYNNNHPALYEITEKGEKYLIDNFDEGEIFNYIRTRDKPDFLLEFTKNYIEKKKSA